MDFTPKFTAQGSFTPDDLVVGGPLKTDVGTLLAGQNLTRGTLLGKVSVGTASVDTIATKGALTMDGTTPLLAGAKAGAYKVACVLAASNAGKFNVIDPDGISLGLVDVAGTFANQIKFSIADGGVDFAVGDTFTVTVTAGSGKLVKSLKAAVDGSQYPVSILSVDTDATSADKPANVFIAGEFNQNSIVFGTGHTAANTKDALRDLGIHLKSTVAR